MLIFSDIAGQYQTLLKLVEQIPDEYKTRQIALGDLIDRGPDSLPVVRYFMNHEALLGNHELMMLEALYQPYFWMRPWLQNGGAATLLSFGLTEVKGDCLEKLNETPEVQWMDKLPLFVSEQDVIVTHAPIIEFPPVKRGTFVWNREDPVRRDKFQIFGHNAYMYRNVVDNGVEWFEDDEGQFAVCIDSSHLDTLTAIHWPSKKIWQQKYIEQEE